MLFRKKKKETKEKFQKVSYAQSGEDLIIDFVFSLMRIEKPTYLDIGAHHPHYLSNTAFFYEKGCYGVSVEPDPELFKVIKKERPEEVALNVGVSDQDGGEADFYIINVPTLNTFSKVEADRYASYEGKHIKEVVKIPLMNINTIVEQKFNGKAPNFVSIDVEGMDMVIVKSFDFEKYRPEVFCIETITYTENNTEEKLNDIIEYVLARGYFLYADTYINSIFVDKTKWKNR
ncbi:MAG: SAM-dependent methyltransferase [Bacteroidetes bacterium]|nr:SAM-dependent methyltransferase [Bacteroidota bacterium]